MNRRVFIESQGATCRNWSWSWSFINESEKTIIFGAWDIHTKDGVTLILSEEWRERNGRVQPGYTQAYEHIQLIENQGFVLKTFPMEIDVELLEEEDEAKIKSFGEELHGKALRKVGGNWYAVDIDAFENALEDTHHISDADELDGDIDYLEGAQRTIRVNAFERSTEARRACLEYYGYRCSVCDFDFEKAYGELLGKKYIHVHHIVPISEIREQYAVNPISDLRPVCPNCHAMIHRTRPPQSISDLKRLVGINKRNTS